MITEKEAKEKFCPIIKCSGRLCMGSECMMWEWDRIGDHDIECSETVPNKKTPSMGHCGFSRNP